MADISGFYGWVEKFEQSRRGRDVLNELDKRFPPDKESTWTRRPIRDVVLTSCYGAAMFEPTDDPINDPDKNERLADAEALRALEPQRDAIAILRKFAKKHRKAAGIVFSRTIFDLKKKGIEVTDRETRDVADLLDCILETYSSRLVKPIPFVAEGPSLNRFLYGCLHYETPLDDHKRFPDVETMLLFDLVQTFRLRSQRIPVRDTGQRMPKEGKPRYPLATAFVNATFSGKRSKSTEVASTRLKAFLRTNPMVGIVDWPALRF